jgi:GDPmannose 4,6-dehydratase
VEKSFAKVGMPIEWRGDGVDEKGYDATSGHCVVAIDPRYFRPTEVDLLIGNPTKAHTELGWKHETTLDQLVAEMVREDLKVMARNVPTAGGNKGLSHA